MRYLKLASAKNPTTDFIELNDFNGFLCTSFKDIGISRRLEFLTIKNRQFVVDNKTNFKKYSLTIEILSKYSEYERLHRELITFLDRNKKDGFRLYYRPYNGMDLRYCLCDIVNSVKIEKMQPVVLTLSQGSLWLGEKQIKETTPAVDEQENLYAFTDDGNGYYSASFALDEETNNYCIEFYNGALTEVVVVNSGYNEIPLNIRIYGECANPVVSLYKKGESVPIKTIELNAKISKGYYIEILADVINNGIWYVKENTDWKQPYDDVVNNENGSPYIYVDNGEYIVRVVDGSQNIVNAKISYQEEYSE